MRGCVANGCVREGVLLEDVSHLPDQRRVIAIRCTRRPYQIRRVPSRLTVKKDGRNGVVMIRHLQGGVATVGI